MTFGDDLLDLYGIMVLESLTFVGAEYDAERLVKQRRQKT